MTLTTTCTTLWIDSTLFKCLHTTVTVNHTFKTDSVFHTLLIFKQFQLKGWKHVA